MEKIKHRTLVIFILGLLSTIGAFSIDMYLPGFPDIAESLNTTVSEIALSLSSFFIGISIGQLIYGPILDRFGRKIPLYIGLVLYLIASVFCAYVVNADQLILARFFQALGSCAGMVASRALVRDLFPVDENAKVFSYLMLVIAISPIIAPTFGGFVTKIFGWQAIFISLAVISFLTILMVYAWLPNGNPPDPEISLKPKPITKGYINVAKVPKFYTYALISAVSASGLYVYIAGSPKVFMGIYEVSKNHYGLIFAFIALGMTFASQTNTFLLRKYSSERITVWALGCQVVSGLVLMALTYFGWINLYSIIGLIWVFLGTQGFVYPNTSALCLSPFSRTAGTASALMGAIQLGIGALVTAIVGLLPGETALPMTVIMFTCALLSFVILLIGTPLVNKADSIAATA